MPCTQSGQHWWIEKAEKERMEHPKLKAGDSLVDVFDKHKQKQRATVCVLDASTYVGFWILKGLLAKGYAVHAAIQKNSAGEGEITKKMREMEKGDERLRVSSVDILDYQSILRALRGCCALFCCLDGSDGYDESSADMEARQTINVIEACAHTDGMEKVVFTSSLAAAIWKDNIGSDNDVDERSWSDQHLCRKLKLWYALSKTLSEQAAWALAMDRAVNMVSINCGLVLGPKVTQQNPKTTMAYLKGAPDMYKNGVLACVNIDFLVDVHIKAFEDQSTRGRYFCFDQVVKDEKEAMGLGQRLSPLISLPQSYDHEGSESYADRLRTKKLDKLVEAAAY